MLTIAKVYFLIFGLITIVSGLSGYLKAGSKPSLIAGGALGALLLLAGFLMPGQWRVGLGVALFICLALAGRFLPAVLKGVYNPGAYLVPLALIGIVIAVMGFFQTPAGS